MGAKFFGSASPNTKAFEANSQSGKKFGAG
jgi:hypothetical protein